MPVKGKPDMLLQGCIGFRRMKKSPSGIRLDLYFKIVFFVEVKVYD